MKQCCVHAADASLLLLLLLPCAGVWTWTSCWT
jgi:hypothetical protein